MCLIGGLFLFTFLNYLSKSDSDKFESATLTTSYGDVIKVSVNTLEPHSKRRINITVNQQELLSFWPQGEYPENAFDKEKITLLHSYNDDADNYRFYVFYWGTLLSEDGGKTFKCTPNEEMTATERKNAANFYKE